MSQLRFLVDEDLDNDIVRGVLRRLPATDLVRVQDCGLSGASDPEVLEWAAGQGRVVLTHDVSTMLLHAKARIAHGQAMPGLFAISQSVPVGQAIEEILLIAACSMESEWHNQIHFLPL